MTPEEFENLLIAEIELMELPVRAYPENPKDYFPEQDPGEVLVRFEGRKPIERDITGQYSKVKFFAEFVVVTRQVRDTNGAYDWLERLYNHFEGYTLEECTGQMYLNVESFMSQEDDLWQFGQKWSVETDVYQTYTDNYEQHNLGIE